jgi:hypothetical protein
MNGVKKKEGIQVGMKRKNKIAKDLRTQKYRPRVIKNKKKEAEKRREDSMKLLYKLEYLR